MQILNSKLSEIMFTHCFGILSYDKNDDDDDDGSDDKK